MNSVRSFFSTFRINMAVVVFMLVLVLAPSAVLAQAGWQPQTLPALEQGVTYSLADIKALSATEAWISGGLSTQEAFVMKTTNGTSWNLIFRKGADANPWISFGPFNRLSLVDSNTAWVGGTNGLTAFTGNGGSAWSREAAGCFPESPAYPPIHVFALKAVDATNVWTGGYDNSASRGLIWHRPYSRTCTGDALNYYRPYRPETVQGTPIMAIDAADADNAWAVLYALGGILHTTDGGNNWTLTGSPTGGYLYDVAVVNASVAWVVGGGGGIAKTSDGGSTWVVQGSGVTETLNKISAVSADIAWAVGGNGTILKTVDGGATWRSQVSGTAATLVGVAAADANTAWVVGDGVLLATTDGGAYQPLSAPGVRDVSPAGGPIAGGTVVTVGGRDFRPGARVYIDDVLAARAYAGAGYEGYVTTPPHAAGFVDVTVVNPDGQTATLKNGFAYADTQPLIVRLSPSYGYVDSPAEVDIYGAGLTPEKGVYEPVPKVNFNGTAVPGIYADYDWVQVVFDRTRLTAAGPGMEDITVTTTAGTSNTLKFAVNPGYVQFQRPSTEPYDRAVTIPSLAGDDIQATFHGLNQSGSVRVGKAFDDPQWIGGNSPPPAGYRLLPTYYYDVATYPSYMHYQAATFCFPYLDSDLAAAGLDESRLRLMRFFYNPGPTWEDVTVTLDAVGKQICGTSPEPMMSFALAQGPATPPPPLIQEIVPAISPPSGGSTVTINGRRFPAGATVTFDGVAATNVTVVNGIKITATIPPHALGLVDVAVAGPGGPSGVLTGGFEYVGPPAVTSLTPSNGYYDTQVTITGYGFREGCTATFGGQTVEAYSVTDTKILVDAPQHAAGLVDVVVTNVDGQSATLVNAFTYVPAPTVAYIEPNAGTVDGGTAVTITGTGFQVGAVVTFGYTEAVSVVVVNPTTMTAVTPANAAETVSVTVYNPDGQSGTSNYYSGFAYGKSPSVITWANPATIPYGTKLSATQLNATANVAGTFIYVPAAGTTPSVGVNTLNGYFTPSDTEAFPRAQKTVSLVVLPALGDLNADGAVNVLDAIMVLQVMSARLPVPAVHISADVNSDGDIGMEEAIFILQKAAGARQP